MTYQSGKANIVDEKTTTLRLQMVPFAALLFLLPPLVKLPFL